MREDKFIEIEDKLSNILKKIGNENYLKFINSNSLLKDYDSIMSKIDNGDYPENFKDKIDDKILDEIIILLNEKNDLV